MPQLKVEHITKRFGSLVANDDITLDVPGGKVLAILGENGAGKSTLMKVIAGLLTPDAGQVLVDGQPIARGRPDVAIRAGIGMIHQHFMLIPRLSVWENIILGHEPRTRLGAVNHAAAVRTIRELSRRYGLEVDPEAPVSSLTVGERQRVEILKAFYRGAQVLILDEPTALLTPQETQELFLSIKHFAQDGFPVVFISHKLDEVLEVSDRVVVIRQGRVTGDMPTAEATPAQLAELMVGRAVVLRVERDEAVKGDVALELEDLEVAATRHRPQVGPISLSVRRGEILGIAGVDGNGQLELAEALVGLIPTHRGRIRLGGREIQRVPVRRRTALGLGYVPADRQVDGLVLDFPLWQNFILRDYGHPPYRRGAGIDRAVARSAARQAVDAFDIRPGSIDVLARQLSGGNQQKLVLAREILRGPEVLVVAQPTRGLDVGAVEFVHRRLLDLRREGAAILLISLELDEVLALSDAIAVLFRGRLSEPIPAAEATRDGIGLMMAGQGFPTGEAAGA